MKSQSTWLAMISDAQDVRAVLDEIGCGRGDVAFVVVRYCGNGDILDVWGSTSAIPELNANLEYLGPRELSEDGSTGS